MASCAICRQPLASATSKVGVFCSPRCQQIDLGRWLGGDYVISRPIGPEDFEGESAASSEMALQLNAALAAQLGEEWS